MSNGFVGPDYLDHDDRWCLPVFVACLVLLLWFAVWWMLHLKQVQNGTASCVPHNSLTEHHCTTSATTPEGVPAAARKETE